MSLIKNSSYSDMVYEYLTSNDSLEKVLELFPNNQMSFHWANWKDTCLFQKKEVRRNSNSRQRLTDLIESIEIEKNRKVWIASKTEIIESNLYELYQFYLDPRIRLNWLNREEEMLISLSNISGPYIALSSMRWFSNDTYKRFIYHKILTGNMCLRSFRVDVDIPLYAEFTEDEIDRTEISIRQLTEDGVLFHFQDRSGFFKFTNSDYLKISLEGEAWHKFINSCCSDNNIIMSDKEIITSAKLSDRVISKYSNTINLKTSSSEDNYYFYVSYDDFVHLGSKHTFRELFVPVVLHTKTDLGGRIFKAA